MKFIRSHRVSLSLLFALPLLLAISIASGQDDAAQFPPPKPAVVPDGTWIVLQAGEVVEQPEIVTLLKTAATGSYDAILYPQKGRPSNFHVVVSTDAPQPIPPGPQPQPPAPIPPLSATAKAAFDLGKQHAKAEAERFAAAAKSPPATAAELAAQLLAADRIARKNYEAKLLELLKPLGDDALPSDAAARLADIAKGFAEAGK